VTGLTNGTSYTFTVIATNANGNSAPSAPSNAVTPAPPAAVPGPPVIGMATGADSSGSVAFAPPAADGGSPITGYTVTSSPDGKTATGPASPLTVTGLTNGTSYTFTVIATNANGNSAPSAPSNAVTPGAAPPPPPAVSCYDAMNHCWGVDRLTPFDQAALDSARDNLGNGKYPDFVGRYLTRGTGSSFLTASEVQLFRANHVGIYLLADKTGGCDSVATGNNEADSAAAAAQALGLNPGGGVGIYLDEDEGVTVTPECMRAYADELTAKHYQPGFYLNPHPDHEGNAYCSAITDPNVASAVIFSDQSERQRPDYTRGSSPAFGPDKPSCGDPGQIYGWQYIQPSVAAAYGQQSLTYTFDVDELAPDRRATIWAP